MRLFELFNSGKLPPHKPYGGGGNFEPEDSLPRVLANHLLDVAHNIQDSSAEEDDEEYKIELEERAEGLLSLAVIFRMKGMKEGLNALYTQYLFIADYAEEVARDQLNIDLHDMYGQSGLTEAKLAKKVVVKVAKPRNPVLQHAHISGRTAGPHTKKGYDRNKEKRKSVDD